MRRPPLTPANRRPGFTMVEVLVVILIIAILMALLLPAINAAVIATNNARVAAEENNLQTALADFKNRYGEYPPSRIILHNLVAGAAAPYGANTTAVAAGDITVGDLNQRTVRAMRKYFPRAGAYFPSTGLSSITWSWPFAPGGAAATNGFAILSGDECLVFFLGGMPQLVSTSAGSTLAVSGFNRDPANPFNSATAASGTSSRQAPIFEFAPQRLVDVDGDGFPSYIDPLSASNVATLQVPYAYFSAYGNNGYDPNDCNSAEVDDGSVSNPTPQAFSRQFYVNFNVSGGTRVAQSAGPNPYTIGDATISTANMTWANPQSMQIISAGRDGLWGLGGPYDGSASGNRLPVYSTDATAVFPNDSTDAEATALRKREKDNVSNFAGGRLD